MKKPKIVVSMIMHLHCKDRAGHDIGDVPLFHINLLMEEKRGGFFKALLLDTNVFKWHKTYDRRESAMRVAKQLGKKLGLEVEYDE
jgi:hypothetical protein